MPAHCEIKWFISVAHWCNFSQRCLYNYIRVPCVQLQTKINPWRCSHFRYKRERETRHACNWQNHCYYSQPVSDCRRERAFVSQIKNKEIKTAWKLQKQRETDVCTGWCNVCAEMKVKGADTDSVLNTGKQNSFQPDGGSPTATRLYRGHSISVSRQMCVFVCRLLQERYCCTVYL